MEENMSCKECSGEGRVMVHAEGTEWYWDDCTACEREHVEVQGEWQDGWGCDMPPYMFCGDISNEES